MKTMLGSGPQELEDASYPSHFYLYPWRAMNPQTRLPEDERHWWTALSEPLALGTEGFEKWTARIAAAVAAPSA